MIDKVRFRDLILNLKSGDVRKLSELNYCVDSLGYPLCLPYGTATYRPDLKRRTGVTMIQYYLFQLQARTGNRPNPGYKTKASISEVVNGCLLQN